MISLPGIRLGIAWILGASAMLLSACQAAKPTTERGRIAASAAEAERLCVDSLTLNVGAPPKVLANCDRAIAVGAGALPATGAGPGSASADLFSARAAARTALFDLDGALADRSKAAEIDPDSAFRQRDLGWSLSDLDRHAEALDAFDAALAIDPEDTNALAGRAASLRNLGRYEEALAVAEAGRAREPRASFFLREIGWSHHGAGRWRTAEHWFRQATAADDVDAWAFYGLGWVLDDLGRYAEALAAFDRAIAIDPAVPYFHSLRGNTLVNLGRPVEALDAVDRALALYAGDGFAYRVRGFAMRGLGRLDAAADAFRLAAETSPDDDQAQFWLAVTLSDLDRHGQALAPARIAAELDAENANNWHLLGYLRLATGDPSGAIDSFRRVLALDGAISTARYHIATAEAQLGRGEAALEALADALAHDANPRFASEVVAALRGSGLESDAQRAADMIGPAGVPGRT